MKPLLKLNLIIIILMNLQLSSLYASTDSNKTLVCHNSFYNQFPFEKELIGESVEVTGSNGTYVEITFQESSSIVKVTNLEKRKLLSPYRLWYFGSNTEVFDLGHGFYVISEPQYSYYGDGADGYEWEIVEAIEPIKALSESNINAEVYINNGDYITIIDIDTGNKILPTLDLGFIFPQSKNSEVFTLSDGRQIKAIKSNELWSWKFI